MQVSILQFAQITVDRRLRGAELRRHLADSTLHIEDACLLQVVHDAYFFVHRQAVGRQDTAGHIGDGKIFVYNVDRVVKVRTGEENTAALQDVE